ncbi:hypothetical protein, partial [uncultured Bradyrhizobium sp.]
MGGRAAMSTTFVSSGVTSSGLIETGGNTLEVLNGGSAVSTTLSSGGQLLVDSGGYAAATTISSGGSATISAGGAMSGTGSGSTGVFNSDNGTVNVLAGGVVDHIRVGGGGVLNISSGGSTSGGIGSGTGVFSGGVENVLAGGSAAFIAVYGGGVLNVAGETLSTVGISGGVENVLSGGFISGAPHSGTGVYAGGTLNISAGGSGAFVGVNSGGTANVAGVILSNSVISSGGVENVLSGGLISGSGGTFTGDYGTLNLQAGGSATRFDVFSGGIANVAGSAGSIGVWGGTVELQVGGSAGEFDFSGPGVSGGTGFSGNGGKLEIDGTTMPGATISGFVVGDTINLTSESASHVTSVGLGANNVLQIATTDNGTLTLQLDPSQTFTNPFGRAGDATGTDIFLFTSSGGSGNITVSSGQTDVGLVISSGQTLNVLSGGTTVGTVLSGGTENVFGAEQNAVVSNGGVLNVSAGGTAHAVLVSSGGTLNVAGMMTSNTAVFGGGVENVLSGGFISGTFGSGTGISGGTVNVSAGGSAAFIKAYSGGTLNVAGTVVSEGGVASGGVENVLSGGLISGATSSGTGVSAGGVLNLLAGGSATHVGVSSGGTFNVFGNVLSNAAVYSGGVENVSSGGSISGAIGSGTGVSGGTLNVLAGGSAAFVGVSSGGIFNVAGTVLSNVSVVSGGVENVLSGGVVTGVPGSGTGVSGGTVNVFAGGALDHLTVSSGTMNVSAGGTAHNVVVSSGTLNVAGTMTSNVTVSSGGVENVLSGGLISGTFGSGTLISAAGTVNVLAGGTGAFLTVSSGGTFNVAGTVLSNVTVSSGAIENVLAGGVVGGASGSGTAISGGTLNVSSGGSLAYVTAWNGGVLNVSAGGTAHNITVSSGVTMNVAGTITSNTYVTDTGVENVLSGGLISGVTSSGTGVASGGILNVSAGGSAVHIGVSSGGTFNVAGQVLSNTAVYSGGIENVLSGGSISGASGSGTGISGGTVNVSAGGSASYVGVSSGGIFNVAGTTLSMVGVRAGGVENVLSGGLISGAIGSGTGVSAGGILNVLAGGSAAFVGVSSGGVLNVAGAVTNNIGVFAGGIELVSSGGSTGPVTIAGGQVELQAGSVASGGITFSGSGGQLKIDGTSMPTTTISGLVLGDSIDLAGVTFSSGGSATLLPGNVLRVTEGGSSYSLQLDQTPAVRFSVSVDTGGTGTLVTTHADNPPVTTAANVTAILGESSVLSSALFSVSDADGDVITQYAFWDTQGNGHWAINGVTQATNQEIDVPAANLSQVSYVFGPSGSTDTLFVRANDGTAWGGWTQFTAKAFVDTPPTVIANNSNVTAAHGQTSVAASTLFTVTDPDVGQSITQFAFWDTGGNGHWVVNGITELANTEIDVLAANLSQVSYVFGPTGSAPDTLYIRANDGMLWGAWTGFTATPGPDQAPVVTAPNVTAIHGEASALATSLFTATDADHDAITTYAFWDTGGNGHWTVNGVAQAANTEIDVSAANLSQLSYVFGPTGSAPDTLYIRANDGFLWGAWTAFTATPGPDQAPVVTAPNVTVTQGETTVLASNLFTTTDADHDAITQYGFWDTGGNGHWVVNGVAQAANTEIDVSAANLSQVSYVFGAPGSMPDTLYVRANDGYLWGAWTAFTAPPGADTPPVVTAQNVTAIHGETSALATSLFSATGNAITQYAFWDTGGNGHWVVNGVAQAANTEIDVSAANLSQVSYVFGPTGSTPDTLYVRANDGFLWGAWTAFTATPGPDQAPVVTAPNVTVTAGETSVLASNLFSVTDADHDAITQYAFWDTGGNGHWVVNGVAQAASTEIDVSAANLSQVSYVFGPSGAPSDTLYIRANDGYLWGAWTAFTAPSGSDHPPVVTAPNVAAVHGETSALATSLFTATDADHNAITQYAFWDTGGNGHWAVNGVAQAANTEIDVSAANLSQVSYVFGPTGTPPDLLYVRANDGLLWGSWTAFTATPGPDQAPVVTASSATGIHDHSVAATSLFTATDADNDAIAKYAFWDTGGNGHWVVNGVAQAANTEIDVSAANLSQVSYVFGPGGSPADLLYVRANDGMLWGNWTAFSATATNQAPTVSASNVVTVSGQTFAASSLFSATDADGDTITKYALWDSNTNGAWIVNSVTQQASAEIDITAAQLSQTTYQAGPGNDLLWVRANDGIAWGAWQPFNVTGESSSNATIASGATLELPGASNATVLFQSSTGTLKLDNS